MPSNHEGMASCSKPTKLIPLLPHPRRHVIIPPFPHMLRGRDERSVRECRVRWGSLHLLWHKDDLAPIKAPGVTFGTGD